MEIARTPRNAFRCSLGNYYCEVEHGEHPFVRQTDSAQIKELAGGFHVKDVAGGFVDDDDKNHSGGGDNPGGGSTPGGDDDEAPDPTV